MVQQAESDQALIEAVVAGRGEAFRDLIKRYESQVAATVIGMLGRCPEAQDVGQEVFVRFYRSLGRFRGDASVGTYLTRIAMNLSLNELKRRKRRSQRYGGSTEDIVGLADPRERPDKAAEVTDISEAILKLDPRSRAVVVLRLVKGYSTRETAKALKLPQGTVLSRLSRAQKALKDMLADRREE